MKKIVFGAILLILCLTGFSAPSVFYHLKNNSVEQSAGVLNDRTMSLNRSSQQKFVDMRKEAFYKDPKVYDPEYRRKLETQVVKKAKAEKAKLTQAEAEGNVSETEGHKASLTHLSKKENNGQKHLIDVPLISQLPELPKGCEVTSLAMLLASAGKEVSKMTLAQKIPKVPFIKNGLHGNPNNGFVGNMYTWDEPGLGVFHGPIANLAKKYLGNRVVDLTGSKWDTIEKYLTEGQPVWVIVTSRYRHLPDRFWRTWNTKDGKIRITYKEHSVVLTGFDDQYVYFNDPLTNSKNLKVSKQSFKEGWIQFGRQAISYH